MGNGDMVTGYRQTSGNMQPTTDTASPVKTTQKMQGGPGQTMSTSDLSKVEDGMKKNSDPTQFNAYKAALSSQGVSMDN